jgi:beta-N-acetylhexosaminidase
MTPRHISLGILRLLIAVGLAVLAYDWRAPLLSTIRYPVFAALIAASITLLLAELWMLRKTRGKPLRAMSAVTLLISAASLVWALGIEARFQWVRYAVLSSDPNELAQLGRHIVVGYRRNDMLNALLERRAIAGVYISAANVAGRSATDVARNIENWQQIRRRQGLPPLWISTDQEGGAVSRLSPPLPRPSSLGEIVAAQTDNTNRDNAVREYAAKQAQELRTLGVNLNLAPVVDINHRVINAGDRYSQIYRRAISDNPRIVAEAASIYCASLRDNAVDCVLKHFPGLGRVTSDTHVDHADLDTPIAVLAQTDWIPFRALMQNRSPFVMLSHVRLTALDPDRPASFSPAVIEGLLRRDWKFQGPLITDDATMGAFYGSASGITGGAIEALNAGVDLILISYDADQYFPVMYALLQAARTGALRQDRLRASDDRLSAARLSGSQ